MSSRHSFSSTALTPTSNPICDCGIEVLKLTSWTDANPGRTYYKCEALACGSPSQGCNYFGWADKEPPPHGWPKVALLNARDKIHILEVKNDRLKRHLATLAHGRGFIALEIDSKNKQTTVLAFVACMVSAMALVAALMK